MRRPLEDTEFAILVALGRSDAVGEQIDNLYAFVDGWPRDQFEEGVRGLFGLGLVGWGEFAYLKLTPAGWAAAEAATAEPLSPHG